MHKDYETLTTQALRVNVPDEAERVRCPDCDSPILEVLYGVIRTICRVCKWSGIITKNDVSMVQSHQTIKKGQDHRIRRANELGLKY